MHENAPGVPQETGDGLIDRRIRRAVKGGNSPDWEGFVKAANIVDNVNTSGPPLS